jgi:Flp pilus assembly protein TadB
MLAPVSEEPVPVGKGRPTPKRREARKQRRTATPTNRKEAAAMRRQKLREQRGLQRQALHTGDERHLPPRDQGAGKKLTREYVDGRFTLGQVFFGMVIVLFFTAFFPVIAAYANLLLLLLFVLVIVDAVRVGRGAKQAVLEKYGDKEAVGIVPYAMLRAMQPRRMRRPPAPKKAK